MPRKNTTIEDPALTRALRIIKETATPDDSLVSEYSALADSYKKLLKKFHKTIVISDSYEAQHQEILRKLEETTYKYRQLKDVALPICMYCKKIRSDDDYWQQLETFFLKHADIMFSHGICPDCFKTYYEKMGVTKKKVSIPNTVAVEQTSTLTARKPVEDDALREMRALVRQGAFDGNPLSPEVEQFVEKYGKLLRRFNKIVSISDSYQSQLMELNTRLELMSRIDLLTGLSNRWDMLTRLESEKSRAERHGTTFSVIFADIDLFKSVNDTHGHMAGDRVLSSLANTLRSCLRSEDICSRWGGDEFLVILPETDLLTARLVAEKLLNKVREATILWEGKKISVTMSMGYGTYSPGMSIDQFVKQVDDALYNAKAVGRDRILAV